MTILKILAAGVLAFAVSWALGRLRNSNYGIYAILDAIDIRVKTVVFYVLIVIILVRLYLYSFASPYFLAIAIGATIPMVRFAIADFKDNF